MANSPKIIAVAGKGGVGKTSISATISASYLKTVFRLCPLRLRCRLSS